MDDHEENREEEEDENEEHKDDDDEVEYRQEPWRPAVESGDLSQLQDLVRERGLAVLTRNYLYDCENADTTALLEAVRGQHMGMVRYLLEECSSVVDVNARSDDPDYFPWYTSLHIATDDNNVELVRILVEKGCDVNAVTSREEKTALHMAVEMKHVDIAKCLIDTGLCDLDLATSRDSDPALETALSLAVGYNCGSLQIVQYLMEHGPWTDEEKADRATKVLPAPCQCANLEIVKYLVESCQADVNAISLGYYGSTPLVVACRRGCLEIVQYLVEKCYVNPESRSGPEQNMNPLLAACESGHLSIVQYLVEKCVADVVATRGGNQEASPWHFACQTGKLDIVQYLVEKCRIDIEAADSKGNTALHEAARYGRLDIVQLLVEKCGSNVDAKTNDQQTALHCACGGFDATAVVKYIVEECNTNVDLPDAQGATALHVASQSRSVEMVQCLIRSGRVNVNAVDTSGQTAMHSCLVGGYYGSDNVQDGEKCLQVAKTFAAIDQTIFGTRDKDGRTVLHLACRKAWFKLVQYLVQDCRVDVNAASNVGETALHIACRERHVAIAQWLTSLLEVNVDVADKNGRTALHFACSALVDEERARNKQEGRGWTGDSNCCKIVDCLLKTGRVNVNAQDEQGKTALHHSFVDAVEDVPYNYHRQGHIQDVCLKIVQSLVESGQANVDATDSTGQTALHYYCSFPNIEIPRYLIEQAHANVDATDNEGRTALHRAASIPRGAGTRSELLLGLRLVLFLVSRLSSDMVGHDDFGF